MNTELKELSKGFVNQLIYKTDEYGLNLYDAYDEIENGFIDDLFFEEDIECTDEILDYCKSVFNEVLEDYNNDTENQYQR
jgi:hypothetical protein